MRLSVDPGSTQRTFVSHPELFARVASAGASKRRRHTAVWAPIVSLLVRILDVVRFVPCRSRCAPGLMPHPRRCGFSCRSAQSLPFFDWCISGSRLPSLFLVAARNCRHSRRARRMRNLFPSDDSRLPHRGTRRLVTHELATLIAIHQP
jgi:hypothetical protein